MNQYLSLLVNELTAIFLIGITVSFIVGYLYGRREGRKKTRAQGIGDGDRRR